MSWRPSPLAQVLGRIQALHQSITARGGVLSSCKLLLTIVKHEGLAGVRRILTRASRLENYGDWVRQFDSIDMPKRAIVEAKWSALRSCPTISIIVPVFNPEESVLRQMIESVLAQIYPHWELCLCDDASTAPHVYPLLKDFAEKDTRIKVMRLAQNSHICVASNAAAHLATGSFIALLDHDDLLPEHAMSMVAEYINRHPNARMFYSDEDKIGPDNTRIEPYFKSDWNPVLMLGQNMFSHLGVFEKSLFDEVSGFRVGFEGSQDHDLVLRCAERVKREQIIHIPHVLYHWRLSAQSTAGNVAAKPYVKEATMRVVREHLERTHRKAHLGFVTPAAAMIRVIHDLPAPAPLVSIIIPTRDQPEILRLCLQRLTDLTCYPAYEVLVVDNGSANEEALAVLAEYSIRENFRVIRIDEPFNFASLNNQAAAYAHGSVLCLLNNDIEITQPDWLDILVAYALQDQAGAVGAALWYPNGRLQHGGIALAGDAVAGHLHHMLQTGESGYFGRALLAQELSAVTAACLVVQKARYDEVGGLSAELAVAYNDVDFCLKLRTAGYHNVYVPYARLNHHESLSRGKDSSGEKAERLRSEAQTMLNKWQSQLQDDPFLNPNLSIDAGRFFSLAIPPRIGQFG